MNINAYLYLNGNCKEVFDFYAQALNGSIVESHPYSDNPMMCAGMPLDWHNKIMHISLAAGDILLYGSDVMTDGPFGLKINPESSPINLSLNFSSEAEQTEVFNKLADGGKITMPLQNTFWGAKFGMLSDKFGIRWMFNFDKNKI